MAFARNSLRAFLSHAKRSLKTSISRKDTVTLVIGNESADLDSITCSILFSYIQSIAPRSKSPAHLYIPVLNIPKSDIALRPELLALLPHANVESDHLITLDDLPSLPNIESELSPESTRWILVDHNALQGVLGSTYSHRVVGVIDHHEDEGKVLKDTGDEPRIITASGSCTSLVTNYCRDAWERLSLGTSSSGAAHAQGDTLTDDSAVAALWDAQVAQLAMASILIDTMNLKDENKTKDHDRKAVEFLEAKIGLCGKVSKDFQRDTFFEKINEAKKDLDSLALRDILRKDYKQWTENGMNLGMSSIVKPLSFLRSKAQDEGGEGSNEAFVNALKKFAKERKLGVFAIMTAFTSEDGAFSRELLTMSSHSDGQKVLEKFADSKGSDLELEDDNGKEEDGLYLRMWRQKNVSCSRKQVAPMLRSAMS